MDTTPAFDRLRLDFLRSRVEKTAATAGAVGVVVIHVALLALLYLFVDLLVWKGEVPSYDRLTPRQQRAFAAEWDARPADDRRAAVERLGLRSAVDVDRIAGEGWGDRTPTTAEWELRWRANVYLVLRDRVGPAAAAYLPADGSGAERDFARHLGVLSLVVRERHRWDARWDPAGEAPPTPRTGVFGDLMGWAAGWNEWAWRPNARGENTGYLTGLFILGLGMALVRGVLLNGIAYFAAKATLDTVTRVRRAVYLQSLRLGVLDPRGGGPTEAVAVFTRQTEAVGEALDAWLTGRVRHPLKLALLVVFVLLLNFWLAAAFLAVAFLLWLVAGQVAAYYRRLARLGGRQGEAILAQLQESMGLIRLAKGYSAERFAQARVERQMAEYERANWRRLRGDALSRPVLTSVGLVAAVALLYLAAGAVLAGTFTVPGLAALAVGLASLAAPLAGWLRTRARVRRGREAAEAVYEFLDRKAAAAEAPDAEFFPGLTGRLEFRQVTVRDPGTGRLLLDEVSFAVPAGAKVAVVGADPAERRALVHLLPRFVDPAAGEVRMDDKNVRRLTHESLRAQVSLVLHDDLTFSDTVANNIGCGDPGYSLPQVIEVAKLAHAHQFIEKLPYGYETQVGDHGVALAPGQRFRLALARALLRDPSVLVVEEPTGVDDDTLALLDDTLERAGPGRTVVFLAHRVSTLRAADRVFVLRDGRLVASGTHRDLWQTSDAYRNLQVIGGAGTAETAALKAD